MSIHPRSISSVLPRFCLQVVAFVCFLLVSGALQARELPYGQGLLWRIETAQGAVSHLFGTMHVSDPRVVELPAPVAEAFGSSQTAVFEMVLDPAMQARLGGMMVLQDGRTLEDVLGPALFASTRDAVKPYGLPEQALKLFKPWALISIFSYPPAEFAKIAQGAKPLDEWLQDQAKAEDKSLVGLETPEEQFKLFDDLPEETQVDIVASLVRDQGETEARYGKSIELYLGRDLDSLHRLLVEEPGQKDPELSAEFQERFVFQRNATMADRLASHLARGNAFVAIGALHLPGEKGILQILSDAGYRVSRVY